ncbi:MAG: class I SAM-dependent methyltransferase [Nitrospirales bacterium]|nr:class I SAM-dependent methyltransferase [Nitrospirales bacterium]
MARNWYSQKVFPKLLQWSMKQAAFGPLRESLLAQASGAVLEIGFGTGANVPYYPRAVESITALDPNPGMLPIARSQISHKQHVPIQVRWIIASGETLPFLTHSFDSVVSTMTLCSVPKISFVIQEIHRVLKPKGKFLFLEHGRSPDPWVRRWQDLLTPFWKHLGNGCHLNRPMAELIQSQSWAVPSLKTFYLPGVPKAFAYFYQGCAMKGE